MSQSSPDKCSHTAANGTTCIISHKMLSGEVWTRCMLCGKTTRSAELLNLATEMGFRMGQSAATLVAATADSHAALPMQVGGQTAHFNYDKEQEDSRDTVIRRQKVIEEAGRSAAAAFDAGIEAENNPVKLDSDRKLKAI